MTLLIQALLAGLVLFSVINFAALHTWIERKQSAVMQDRIGANRATIFGIRALGLFHPLADAIKMFTKEDYIPPYGDKFLHTLAPFLSMTFALVTFAAIPFGDILRIGGLEIPLQVAPINVGLIYIFAMLSMGVYGVILAGFSSNSNYAFLGSLRASSQMLAYEITLGATLLGIVMIYGTLDLQEIVRRQGDLLWGVIPNWGVFVQPLGLILFLVAGIAETKRIPYDIPEGESEIVGYFVEYSGMKFGMFYFTDFLETILIASLTTTLFFGGWQVPYLYRGGFYFPWVEGGNYVAWALPHLAVTLIQTSAFIFKVTFFCWLFMTIRWTLPRFRYDQLMHLGWKIVFPLSLFNLFVTALCLLIL